MPDLNIRNVPLELIAELKSTAALSGETLRDFCIEILRRKGVGDERRKVRSGVAGDRKSEVCHVWGESDRKRAPLDNRKQVDREIATSEPGPDAGPGGDAEAVVERKCPCGAVLVPWGPSQMRCRECSRNFPV